MDTLRNVCTCVAMTYISVSAPYVRAALATRRDTRAAITSVTCTASVKLRISSPAVEMYFRCDTMRQAYAISRIPSALRPPPPSLCAAAAAAAKVQVPEFRISRLPKAPKRIVATRDPREKILISHPEASANRQFFCKERTLKKIYSARIVEEKIATFAICPTL